MTQLELFDGDAARPVASTLPDEGLDLYVELQRYRDWLITQALVRTQGNRAGAARLLGIKRTTLVMMLKPKANGAAHHTLTGSGVCSR